MANNIAVASAVSPPVAASFIYQEFICVVLFSITAVRVLIVALIHSIRDVLSMMKGEVKGGTTI
jgi:hypothetical protein